MKAYISDNLTTIQSYLSKFPKMNNQPKSIYSHRLWISRVHSLERSNSSFYLYNTEVSLVQLQGIIISLKKLESILIFVLDDATGVVDCTVYLSDFAELSLEPGLVVRIIGRPSLFQGELSIKLKNPPYVIENFDEEIYWAMSVDKLWRCVYSCQQVPGRHQVLEVKAESKARNEGEEFEVVRLIRESGKEIVCYDEIPGAEGLDKEALVSKFIQEGFLIPRGDGEEIKVGRFEINREPYHPKEILLRIFERSSRPITFDEIRNVGCGKFSDFTQCLMKCINELLEKNIIYEVCDNTYAYIREE